MGNWGETSPFYRLRILLCLDSPAHLRPYPAGAVYALFAGAYGRGRGEPPGLPDGLMIDCPERCRTQVGAGEPYAMGATFFDETGQNAATAAATIIKGLQGIGAEKRTSAYGIEGGFRVQGVEDLVASRPWQPGQPLCPIPAGQIKREIGAVRGMSVITLRFTTPLRMERTKRTDISGRAEGHKYLDRDSFDARLFLGRTLSRLRALGLDPGVSVGVPLDTLPIKIIENRLVWLDIAYGHASAEKRLGGAMGCVRLELGNADLATALVLGQYARVGRNTSFGFGAYRIEELGPDPQACRRSIGLTDIAFGRQAAEAVPEGMTDAGQWQHACHEIVGGSYQPQTPHRVTINTADRKSRVLAIPSLLDRNLQRVVLQLLQPAIDAFLEDSSFAYRRGLSRQSAARRIRSCFRRGLHYAVKADFARFFDSVDHGALRQRLEAYVADPALIALLMTWVQSGAPQSGRGLPTGAPISPLLANLFLDHFDEEVRSDGGQLIRYADDLLVLFARREEAAAFQSRLGQLAGELLLALNRDKTQVLDLSEPFEFLGFKFERHQDQWQMDGRRLQPTSVDDLGWCDAAHTHETQAELPGPSCRLPNESDAPAGARWSVAIIGPGVSSVDLEDGALRAVGDAGKAFPPVRLDGVAQVILLGPPTIGRGLVEACLHGGPAVLLADASGQCVGHVASETDSEDAATVAAQVRAAADPVTRLNIARRLIAAKLRNYSRLATALGSGDSSTVGENVPARLAEAAEHALGAKAIESLLGIEGSAANLWFQFLARHLSGPFHLERRVAPGASDPVNVLMNIAQSVLHRHMILACRQAGLVPSVGILHEPRPGHAALASDLQEPFRHLADRAVLEATKDLRQGDFQVDPDGRYPLRILPRAARTFAGILQRCLTLAVCGRFQAEPSPYRYQFLRQARDLRRSLLYPEHSFRPFEHL